MKDAKQWGREVAQKYKGATEAHRAAIEADVARVVREVRREMDAEGADAIELLEKARRVLER